MTSTQEDIDFDRAYVGKHGLYGFVKLTWSQVCPGEKFADGPHIAQIANHLEAAAHGLIRRLMINVPPGSTKSLLTSVFWPAFTWGPLDMASKKWLFTSFDGELATRDANRSRDLIESTWYQERWPNVNLSGAAQSTYYTNDHGGFRRSVAITGNITGRHPDITVVDDPTNAKNALLNQAVMKTELKKTQAIWKGVIVNRRADPNTNVQVIIMQRLHDADLAGFLQDEAKQEGGTEWTVLRLPMHYEADVPCITYLDNGARFGGDWRTREGEPLCPARWSEEATRDLQRAMGNEWSAQYQQRPANAQGQIFKRAWFRYWNADELRRRGANPYTGEGFDNLICSWDFTFKSSMGSDFVCGQVWAKLVADYFMLERVYKRMNFPNSLTAIEAMIRRWPTMGAKVVEDKANGPAIIASLERKVSGLVPWPNSRGKIANANAVSYLHRSGNVWYPPEFEHATGDEAHVECMAKFPLAKHDDSVDAETQALAYLEENRNALFEALAAQQRAQARQ